MEHAKAIYYNPQKDILNLKYARPIEVHLAPTLKGFVVNSQIPNLNPNPSFDHNLCILYLNEYCENALDH